MTEWGVPTVKLPATCQGWKPKWRWRWGGILTGIGSHPRRRAWWLEVTVWVSDDHTPHYDQSSWWVRASSSPTQWRYSLYIVFLWRGCLSLLTDMNPTCCVCPTCVDNSSPHFCWVNAKSWLCVLTASSRSKGKRERVIMALPWELTSLAHMFSAVEWNYMQ